MMSSAYPRSRRLNIKRKALMISCASLAMATAVLAPQKAQAQAFNGTLTPSAAGSQTFTGTGTETVNVNTGAAGTATLNWTPDDGSTSGNIIFLPSGNTATFVNTNPAVTDYTVLNRVVPTDPTRAIELNGSILSRLNDGTTTGGNIWFYSPGGIVVGSTAYFDVGSLLLSTIDVTNGWTADGNGFSASFVKTQTAAGSIEILSGAEINALNQNSYIALVAPRIEQGGNVQVNGTAAYVAGDQVSLTMNQGLFDIVVDVGTDDGSGIIHSGITGGVASTGAGDNHRIYMVAVPKNQVLTMGLAGNIGFATSASVENGEIILSAGRNVYEASGEGLWFESNGTLANVHIRGDYSSDVTAVADDRAAVYSDEWGTASFDGDVSLEAPSVHVAAGAGETLTVDGDLIAWSDDGSFGDILLLAQSGGIINIGGMVDLSTLQGAQGSVTINASGAESAVNISGDTFLYAGHWYVPNPDSETASVDHTAGTISVSAHDGGTVTTGNINASAPGWGDHNSGGGDQIAGDGQGGNVYFTADTGGAITVNGDLWASAQGLGGAMQDGSIQGGAGYGGNVSLYVGDGSIDITGGVNLTAYGEGGSYIGEGTPTTAQGGYGQGGFVNIWSDGPGSITIDGSAYLAADGFGGDGQTGGDGQGGINGAEEYGGAGISGVDGSITLGSTVTVTAQGTGGDATDGFGGDGGTGTGGVAYIEALYYNNPEGPDTALTITGGDTWLDVSGTGGDGGAGYSDGVEVFIAAGNGGSGLGGLYTGQLGSGGAFAAAASPASLTLGNTTLLSNGIGGAGGVGGTGQVGGMGGAGYGGSAQAGNYSGDGLNGALASYGSLNLHATGHGGDGGMGGAGQGDGGEAHGGGVFIGAKGTVSADVVGLYAEGFGGDGANGGDAWAGYASLQAVPGALLDVMGDVGLYISAFGGTGSTGSGGDAWGGNYGAGETVDGVFADVDSVIDVGGYLYVLANAFGGSGVTGGSAYGGLAYLESLSGASVTANQLFLDASAIGGDASLVGGSAYAGIATLYLDGGDVTVLGVGTGTDPSNVAFKVATYAEGGDGATGGNAEGGVSEILFSSNGGSLDVTGHSHLSAGGQGGTGSANTGGTGGDGGDGFGGSVLVDVIAGSVSLGNTEVFANGRGGTGGDGDDGGDGGDGFGGDSIFHIGDAAATFGELFIAVRGVGSHGGIGSVGLGGDGGNGQSGSNTLTIDSTGSITAVTYLGTGSSVGGNGGVGATGSGNGGSAQGGSQQITIDGQATFSGLASNFDGLVVTSFGEGGDGAIGGSATAGSVLVEVNGTLDAAAGRVQVSAGAQGGEGTSVGGDAEGGTASLTVNGSLNAVNLEVRTSATGGNGSDQGGNASAGVSTLDVNGTVNATGFTSITADGLGGAGSIGIGGDGSAGTAIITDTGSWTSGGEVFVSSDGEGGDGSAGGGDGYGGDAAVRIEGGTANLTGTVTVRAAGTGGSSSNGTGGDGTGGYARLSTYFGGTATINNLTVDSSGHGGTGVDGGDGYAQESVEGWGGSVIQSSETGTAMTLTGQTTLTSNGTGGAATGSEGVAGDGGGGYASLGAHTGSSLTTGGVHLQANGTGATGTGGTVRLVANGATLDAGTVAMDADGSTTGGIVYIPVLNGGDLTVQSLNATANGALTGGEVMVYVDPTSTADLGMASLAAIGASGGDITIDVGSVTSSASFEGIAGDVLFANNLTLTSTGTINLLSENGASIDLVSVMDATAGGLITLEDNGGNAFITANAVTLDGSSVLFNWDFDAGNVALIVDGNYTLAGLPTAADNFSVEAGGSITAGDLAMGGSLDLDAGTNITVGNVTVGGNFDLDAGGNIVFTSIDAGSLDFDAGGTVTGGNIFADTMATGSASGAISLQNITVGPGPEPADDFSVGFESATSISVGNIQTYGRVGFASAGNLTTGTIQAGPMVMALVGGDILTGAITTDSNGIVFMADSAMYEAAGGLDDEFDPSLVLAATPIATGGSIAINGAVNTGAFKAYAGTTLTTLDLVAASAITAEAGGNLQVGNASAGTSISLDSGGSISATSLDAPIVSLAVAGDFTTGDLFVDETLLLSAGGNLTAANIVAGGSIGLTAGQNLLAQNLSAGGSLTLNAGGSIATGNLTAGDGIAAQAGTTLTVGTVTTGAAPPPPTALVTTAVAATGDDVTMISGGNMTTGAITSTGAITLTSGAAMTTGALGAATNIAATSVGDMQIASASAGQNVGLASGANLTTGNLSGQAVTTSATGSSSVANVNALVSAMFTAGGLANFYGIVSAPTITVTSGDINIADGAALGVFGTTNLLTFNAVTSGGVVIGGEEGSSSSGNYTLAEAGDIRAASVIVNAGNSNVTVRDVQIEGSQTSGGGVSSVAVNTAGSVIVEGAVDYVNAGAGDTLAINAGNAIEVITDTGSISMTDSSGNLAGELILSAADIWIADSGIIEQLETNSDFAGRDEALATNSGTANPDGSVGAGTITANVGDSLLVQNGNTAEQPAGLAVGDGGMTVNNTESDPATVVIYGKQTNSDGSVVTGPEFVEDVDFEGSGGYTQDSTVNGCAVGSGCVPEEQLPGGSESILGPVGMASSDPSPPADDGSGGDDGEEGEEEEEGSDSDTSVDPSVQLINSGPLQLDTTVDEPITSGSDGPGGMN